MNKMLGDGEPIEAELEETPIDLLSQEVAELREDVASLRTGLGQVLGWMENLRAAANGGATNGAEPSATMQPQSEIAWNAWKARLPAAAPKVIDALLIQPLTATQLIAITKTSYSTVQRAISVLRNNGLIENDGTRIKLKRL